MYQWLNLILHQSFEFDAIRYEIYEDGYRLEQASCKTHISAQFSIFGGILFKISNNPTYIDDTFVFKASSDDLLGDRVQYGRLSPLDHVSAAMSSPIVCNIFPQNGVLRFATPNPLRIVEFFGNYKLV